jgi:hypothetical protein
MRSIARAETQTPFPAKATPHGLPANLMVALILSFWAEMAKTAIGRRVCHSDVRAIIGEVALLSPQMKGSQAGAVGEQDSQIAVDCI